MNYENIKGLSFEEIYKLFDDVYNDDNMIAICGCHTYMVNSDCKCMDTGTTGYVCHNDYINNETECKIYCTNTCQNINCYKYTYTERSISIFCQSI